MIDVSELELQEKQESIKTQRFNRRNAFYRSILFAVVTVVAVAELLSK
jgi:hypothetical protein